MEIDRRRPASRIGAVAEGESPYPATERSEPVEPDPAQPGDASINAFVVIFDTGHRRVGQDAPVAMNSCAVLK